MKKKLGKWEIRKENAVIGETKLGSNLKAGEPRFWAETLRQGHSQNEIHMHKEKTLTRKLSFLYAWTCVLITRPSSGKSRGNRNELGFCILNIQPVCAEIAFAVQDKNEAI